ncbi:hypothetical protein ACFPES_03080 [Paenibacillus sp. GCM10023248]|uniref:DUF7667 family protein n=1 Tax=unclassified Paenibacillus TaxID=185978 RepID=UPI0023792D11|nr:hypothetical protein [Paenibacillus sp. MAHUQ-63]MDD9266008.1 hypothetical protein [Paenibacillus sp. MAHUQ-63]
MIGIHEVHRKMAEIAFMNTNEEGILELDSVATMRVIQLLKKNMELVWKHDGLKSLALEAQVAGDMKWVQEICIQIEELEAQMI